MDGPRKICHGVLAGRAARESVKGSGSGLPYPHDCARIVDIECNRKNRARWINRHKRAVHLPQVPVNDPSAILEPPDALPMAVDSLRDRIHRPWQIECQERIVQDAWPRWWVHQYISRTLPGMQGCGDQIV